MFRQLRHKLTVLYAGLFCAALMLIGATAYVAIGDATQRLAREQLVNGAAALDRAIEMRRDALRASARFSVDAPALRQAIETRNVETIQALLGQTLAHSGAGLAFIVTREGWVIGEDGLADSSVSAGLQRALSSSDTPSGVLGGDDGLLYQAVAQPLPGQLGWLILGARFDADVLAIEALATGPIEATTFVRSADGWGQGAEAAFIERQLQAETPEPAAHTNESSEGLALVAPMPTIDGTRAALLLHYDLSGVLSPYGALFGTLIAIALAALALLLVGTWFLSSGITQPLSQLEAAAQKLKDGVFETVVVNSRDELAQLAESFNAMTGALRERERKITQLAYHDAETRLPNRLALERRLAAAPQSERLYLAAIGVDRFADVRGAIGYTLTGALVRTLGQRLSQLAPNAPVARLSSDVLGVAFLANSDAEARNRADALITALEQPVSLEGHDLDVHVSIGLAQPRAKPEPAELIKRASVALDQVRGARLKVGFFDEAAYGDPALNLSLMSEMQRAIDSDTLMLAHQPKYDFRTGRIASAECLVRWRHPNRGLIPPDLFVPKAEDTGHIRALTEWVLKRAIADQRKLSAAGWPLTLSVNISARLLSDDEFTLAAIEQVRQAPHQFCFEITETAVIDNPTKALENIERFAAAGIRISIDDYGSGLSSLAYLKQLPAHELKIDKMFIESITNSKRDALLVRSTIDLAHGLGLDVVAEGVETPAAFALLASMQCDLVQGYLVARPAPVEELITILADERRMRFYQQTAAAGPTAVPANTSTLPRTA